jgi:hypothetical protein
VQLDRICLDKRCPDCGVSLDARSGPALCETCWLVVPQSRRRADMSLAATGRWMRLPPQLQSVPEILAAVRAARWVVNRPDARRSDACPPIY